MSGNDGEAKSASALASEFAQLQREYRNMEQNRRAYTEESQNIIRRQQAAINKLRKDEEALKAELAMEERHLATKGGDSGPSSKLAMVQDQGDMFTQKLAIETRNLEELNKAIKVMKSKILQQRKQMGGVNAAKESQKMVAKQIRILENRLDKALVKFNEALAHNKQLRETIDGLRRERVVFDNIYRKLEKELHEKKKQMATIIESSNQAYEARDQAQMEMTAIEQQNNKERAEVDEQIAELDRAIDADRRRKDMLLREQGKDTIGQRGEMSMEEEARLKKKVAKGVWSMAKDKANVAATEMKVQSYEEAFNKIKAATGITDVDELVKTFIQNEEQNFSLFNFVNEQNNELEKLEEQIQQLHEEEDKYTQESGDDANQHQQLLNDLQSKLQSTEAAAEKYELRYQEAMKTIAALKVGIQAIFLKTECDKTAMADLLSDTQVTEANIMQFLGIIEQRTNEILQMWAAYSRRQLPNSPNGGNPGDLGLGGDLDNEGPGSPLLSPGSPFSPGSPGGPGSPSNALVSILGQGPTAPMGQDTVQINPPSLNEYSSDEGSDDEDHEYRPLTHQELKIKTMKTIHKKAAHQQSPKRSAVHAASSNFHQQQQQQQHSRQRTFVDSQATAHFNLPDDHYQ
ncbi:Coiled-coil domain-containing protein 63 [Hondaea fermentalgiana]|uniref:Coiled-coil domain-containing protein 63 n=1 Tax=Hondaea fermentalgiana TaxID=2315210 RepID=A0A2R5GXT0_9STRA|nr:Coiled-coil domain-containing protein 63 [Hondaea fermentalgiana]|eukprot:GBG32774.1 Coiled-coil domain-containing protein 63 [Hondaea fermentalgiana]